MTDSGFYLGREYDPKTQKVTAKNINYDPADLTTHAVVTGMTGSGKTGLCVALLEEAALQGIPAIIIDPKGDLTNLILHFPELAPQDFQPWIDADLARRSGKTLEQVATDASTSWRNGLKEWGMTPERVLALKNSVQFSVFTPGSDSGIPVSVLSSLAAPEISWQDNRETLRERIASTVTALLGLVGINDIDPIRSREHILLSNIFENAWSQGKDVELTELILQTQTPPFDKLGAFPVDTFFPAKDRMELAMVLNNILAAPAFESWREGQSLDVNSLLYTKEGKPRHSIFYLAHLSDAERMFFVTLLFSAVETWMRTQSGATSLRALLYMDEIFGYLPPLGNPPSKQPLLRMLKQARAFGLGLLLATQNPVDVDYKGLSNAGTWFIGKLQTDQDKNRLLDGLESAAGGVSRGVFDKLISSLGKRVFVLHNVHSKAPELLQTRWVMNFLAGPITRTQIPALNQLANADASLPTQGQPVSPSSAFSTPQPSFMASTPQQQPPVSSLSSSNSQFSSTKPPVPTGVREYFLPQNYSLPEAFKAANQPAPTEAMIESIVYKPALLASAQIRILDRKLGVDSEVTRTVVVASPEKRGMVRWEDQTSIGKSLDNVDTSPAPSAKFGTLDAPLNDPKLMTALQKDFTDWVFRNSSVTARANQALKVFAGPDVTQSEFMTACSDAARSLRDAELEKKTSAIDKKIKSIEDKIYREERELRQDQEDARNRNIEAGLNGVEAVAGLFGLGRKKSLSTPVSKFRMAKNAKEDVRESEEAIQQFKNDIDDLQRQREQIAAEITERWGRAASETTEVTVNPKKTDVYVNLFGVGWMPYYLVNSGGGLLELPAFGVE
ncbi:MAG TPA: type IV secretion system DNA-binding domain-containing protein [Anaerolineales bacterium]|nr:DUF853 family protein [Anaerolineales bacterium]HNQ93163.1 type IV secretion system DNA-binding domain-containing protein [Anaerolineales bacterium]HNS59391.1 type IV secretion system DNA-binding domain-containing protein [Anaerolineales bacterium]